MGVGDWSFRNIYPRGRHKEVAVLSSFLEAYADESGIDGGRLCAVAGLMGSSRQWRLTESQWKRACRGSGTFSAKDFFRRSTDGARLGIYSDWSDDRAAGFIHSLFDAIETHNLTMIGSTIDVRAFRALSKPERRYLTMAPFEKGAWKGTGAPSKPWFLGFSHFLVVASKRCLIPGSKVNFWFDRQNEYEGLANILFTRATSERATPRLRERLGNLVFAPKDEYPGLQAADLIVHTGRSGLQRGRAKNVDQNIAIERLARLPRQMIRHFTANEMSEVLDRVPERIKAIWGTAKLKGDKSRSRRGAS